MSLVLKSNVAYTGNLSDLPVAPTLYRLKNALTIAGTRKLASGYSGALLRVRRSTDGAERDIYALSSGALDTASLLSFIGSATATVPVVYDQSGNNNNLYRTTASGQPSIVKAGVLNVDSQNQPALVFTSGSLTQAYFLQKPPQTMQNYIAAFVEGTFGRTVFAAIDPRDPAVTVFRLDVEFSRAKFLYRNSPTDTLKTIGFLGTVGNSARYATVIDGGAGKAMVKDSLGVVEQALVSYQPMPKMDKFVIGASTANGLSGNNMDGYITAFALTNNATDGAEILKII